MTTTREKGMLAEQLVERYLTNNKFKVIQRNFHCRYGEVDLICHKDQTLYFVEVKASYSDCGNPVENCHPEKIRKLYRTATEFRVRHDGLQEPHFYNCWKMSLALVTVNTATQKATIQWIEDLMA